MKKLLKFLIKKITGSDNFDLSEEIEDGRVNLLVKADPKIMGLIIGKEGKTIKNIRKIVAIRAVLEKKAVQISVTEKG